MSSSEPRACCPTKAYWQLLRSLMGWKRFEFWCLFSQGFSGGSVVKTLPGMQEPQVWSLGLGRSPGEGNGNPLQDSCLGNPMDRGAWESTVHGITKSQTQLSNWAHMHFFSILLNEKISNIMKHCKGFAMNTNIPTTQVIPLKFCCIWFIIELSATVYQTAVLPDWCSQTVIKNLY